MPCARARAPAFRGLSNFSAALVANPLELPIRPGRRGPLGKTAPGAFRAGSPLSPSPQRQRSVPSGKGGNALKAPGAVLPRGPRRPGRMGSYNGLATTPWGCGRKIRHPSDPVRQVPGRWHRAARVPAHLRQRERPRARALRLLDRGIFRVVSPRGSAVRARGQLRDLGSGSKPSRSRTGDWRNNARDV